MGLAVALLLRGQPRETLGARVFSGPTAGTGPSSLRLSCVRRDVGVEDLVPRTGLRVTLAGEERDVACDDAGAAELAFVLGERSPQVLVREGGHVLVAGLAGASRATWVAGHLHQPAKLPVGGDVPGTLIVPGGVFPTDAPTEVTFVPDAPGAVRPTAAGGEIADVVAKDANTRFVVVPRFLRVELTLEREGKRSTFDLSAAPLEVRVDRIQIADGKVTAALRRRGGPPQLHVVLTDREARRRAATVALKKDPSGDAVGGVTLSLDGVVPPAWLEVAPGANATPTLGVPLHPELDPRGRITRDVLALSSIEDLARRESARTSRVLASAFWLLGAGTLAEIFLVLDRVRRARSEIAEHVDAEGGPKEIAPSAVWDAVLVIAMVAFGFAVLAAVFAWRA